ncbi:hypothetical protein [Fervidobacterium sp. 2310opik-2]|uniref:hypothetical protein n=1 Tax=Fervidobacterium sp. 2310opik-2 TaxID=1755815 RepID=UPI0013E0413E|nr:hypothetical protein [Fervidobacterium sp. 2310opik-2]KAF2961997.1 hypothetical protein AS161_06010 [Fervidobacterium sp. 2310opik-2]
MRRAYFLVSEKTYKLFRRRLRFNELKKYGKTFYITADSIQRRGKHKDGYFVRPRELAYMKILLNENDIEVLGHYVIFSNELTEATEEERKIMEQMAEEDYHELCEITSKEKEEKLV